MSNNSNLSLACTQLVQNWIDECDPNFEYEFSKKYEKNKKRLIDKMRGDKYHKLTRNAVRIILIAAIILAIMVTTVLASPSIRGYIVQTFSTYSVLTASEKYKGTIEEDLEIGYIPDGFELTKEYYGDTQVVNKYSNGRKYFFITKSISSRDQTFDSEDIEVKTKTINNVDYNFSNEDVFIAVWNNGEYNYHFNSNLDEETSFYIIQNIK